MHQEELAYKSLSKNQKLLMKYLQSTSSPNIHDKKYHIPTSVSQNIKLKDKRKDFMNEEVAVKQLPLKKFYFGSMAEIIKKAPPYKKYREASADSEEQLNTSITRPAKMP